MQGTVRFCFSFSLFFFHNFSACGVGVACGSFRSRVSREPGEPRACSLLLCHAQVAGALSHSPAAEGPSGPDQATSGGAVAVVQPKADASSPAVQPAVLPYPGLLGNVGDLQMDVQVLGFPSASSHCTHSEDRVRFWLPVGHWTRRFCFLSFFFFCSLTTFFLFFFLGGVPQLALQSHTLLTIQ